VDPRSPPARGGSRLPPSRGDVRARAAPGPALPGRHVARGDARRIEAHRGRCRGRRGSAVARRDPRRAPRSAAARRGRSRRGARSQVGPEPLPGAAPERRRHPARGLCGRSHAGNRCEGDAGRGVLFAQARAAPRDPWRALSDAVDADRRTRPRRDVGPLRTHGRSGRASAPHGPHCRHGPADVGSAARGDGAQRRGAGPAPRVREGRGVHVLSVRRAVRTPLAGAGMSTRKKTAERLTLVGASAGSGKTYRLTEEVAAAIAPGEGAIDLEGLVAVTYTKRAAADLGARIRRTLVEKGAHARAQRLPLAYLGTVHAVCLRLLQEFAIDAGLSPHVDVVPGSEARLLRQALEWGLAPAFRQRVQELADRLQIRWSPMTERTDWLT